MPWLAYLDAAAAHVARVFVGCGLPVVATKTSHSTKMLLPPRNGSGHVNTGLNTQSDASPVACSVDEPSKPQIGATLTPFLMIFVFDRSIGVG